MQFASGARAQFVWELSQPKENNNRYQYNFSALSCSGDNCTVAGTQRDYITSKLAIIFWHSVDGGSSWTLQDPQLPWEIGDNQNKFYGIQQIDSLNVIAIGDTGLVLRTFDGGKTWNKQDCHTKAFLNDVHFSDPLNGMIVSSDSTRNIFTTSDGGVQWNNVSFGEKNFVRCHTFGSAKFGIMKSGNGPLYFTADNWKTIDSTKPFFDSISSKEYVLNNWSITGTDTIATYGVDYGSVIGGLIIRTTDRGKTWEKPLSFPGFNYINFMSALNRDTVFAAGFSINHILYSSDHGTTWRNDSLIVNTNYPADICVGLAAAGNGHYLGTFNGIIIKGQTQDFTVNSSGKINTVSVYPNPASTFVKIICSGIRVRVHILDVLGRECLPPIISDEELVTFDVTNLPLGFYSVFFDHNGNLISSAKFAIIR